MKGSKIAIIVIVVVLAFVLLVGGAIFGVSFLLNREKDSITAEQFKSFMEQNGYTISDATYQFAQYSYVEQVYLAVDSGYNYQIEFYELADESTATGFFNNNASIFESNAGTTSAKSNINGKNYSKYTLSSSGKYMLVSRINNTVVYVNVDNQYSNEVKDILKEIGY